MSRSFETGGAPHFPPHPTVSRVMMQVIFALIPAIAAHTWFFGPGILVQITLAVGFAVGIEALMLKARKTIKLAIPFGPFLAIGGIAYILFGPQLITWYFNLLRPS